MASETVLPPQVRGTWSFNDLAWIWNFYRGHWRLIVVCFLLTTVVAVVATIIKGVQYEVGATLYYRLGAEITPPPNMDRESVVVTRRAEDVNTEIEILRSPDLIKSVVNELGEDFFRDPPPETWFGRVKAQVKGAVDVVRNGIQELLIQARMRRRLTKLEQVEFVLQHALRVEPIRNSDAVSVTLTVSDPIGGEVILKKLLDGYMKNHQAIHRNSGLQEFFTEQHAKLKQELDDSAAKVLAFQTENRVWATDHQRTLLLDRRRLLQQEHADTSAIISTLEAETKALEMLLGKLPTSIELSRTLQRNPAIDDADTNLAALQLNMAALTTSFSEGSRELDDKNRQIEFLQRQMATLTPMILHATTTGISQTFQQLTTESQLKLAQLNGIRSKLKTVEDQLEALESELPTLEAAISKLNALQRDQLLLEKSYMLYSDSLEKARITNVMNAAEISNVSTITPPTASLLPVWPSLKLVVGATVIVGLGLGSGLAFLLELRRAALTQTA